MIVKVSGISNAKFSRKLWGLIDQPGQGGFCALFRIVIIIVSCARINLGGFRVVNYECHCRLPFDNHFITEVMLGVNP